MIYTLLLLFFVLEYVRPTSYFPGLLGLHLNSVVPLTAFAGSALTTNAKTLQYLFAEPSTKLIFALLGLVWVSALTADVQQIAVNCQTILLGFVLIYLVIASQLDSVAKVKGVIMALIVVHLMVAALNPLLLLEPETRHYISSGSFLGDGNDYALSLDVIVPLCLFLVLDSSRLVFRALWGAALLVLIAAVVATQSRGGTIGLASMAVYYWAKSARKWQTGTIAVIAVVLVLVLAPGAYFERMRTIGDTQEGSAQGRLMAWGVAVRMALDNPILGVGAAHFGVKFGNEYRPPSFVGTSMTAHSLYFLALGELGFPGLIVVVALVVTNLRANRRLALELLGHRSATSTSDVQLLASMSAAMLAFAAAGAFLSALYYPHLYVVSGVMVATRRVVKERERSSSTSLESVTPVKPTLSVHWALRPRQSIAHGHRRIGDGR